MNEFLNENWRDIWGELKPVVEEAFAQICKNIINNVFTRMPYKDLFKN